MHKKQRGFSLLELMLVIAVMGVVTVTGLSYIREKALNTKIDKTALQLQQWLQAGVSYYNKKGEWPINVLQLIPDVGPLPSAYYLPARAKLSPWAPEDASRYVYIIGPNQTAQDNQFHVSLEIPANLGGMNTEEVMRRIVAKLPAATWDITNNTITAYIGKSGAPGENGDVNIKGIYIRKVGDATQSGYVTCDGNPTYSRKIPKPVCGGTVQGENAMVPKLYLSIQDLKFPMRHTSKGDESGYPPGEANLTSRDDPADPNAWQAAVIIKGVDYKVNPCSYTGTIMAITACVRQNFDPE